MNMTSYNSQQGIKFFFRTPEKESKQGVKQDRTVKPKTLPPTSRSTVKATPTSKIGKLSTISDKMSSRSSSRREEINSVSSVSFLPPITINNVDGSISPQKHDLSSIADNRYLYLPSETPDSRFESSEFQKRMGSPDCIQCKMNERIKEQSNHHERNLHKEPKKKKKRDVVYIPNGLPEIENMDTSRSRENKRFQETINANIAVNNKIPLSSRFADKAFDYKAKRMYSSLDSGLQNLHLEEEKLETEENLLSFRFRMKDHQRKKRVKTPPKSPFRETILSDLENRRFVKIKEAKDFSASENVVQGLQVNDDMSYENYFFGGGNNNVGHQTYQQNKAEYVSGPEKGSQIFLKPTPKDKVKRPFLPVVDERPQILRGKTVLRNPLAPVTLQDRYKPVVVLKSKLDDYTDAIQDFLEYLIDEQKKSVSETRPVPLDQSGENMVIYKDLDDIAHMKEMAKAAKLGMSTLSKQTKSNPQGQLIKGTTRIKKIGSLDSNNAYRYRTPQKMTVGGHSVFVAPTSTEKKKSKKMETKKTDTGEPNDNSSFPLYGVVNATSAPPNTPYAALQTVGIDTNY